jgi:transposase-like protein
MAASRGFLRLTCSNLLGTVAFPRMTGERDNDSYSDEQKDQAVDLYRRGTPIKKIVEQTGITSALLYYELERRGLHARRKKARDASTLDAQALLERLLEAQRTIERQRLEIEALEKRLGD